MNEHRGHAGRAEGNGVEHAGHTAGCLGGADVVYLRDEEGATTRAWSKEECPDTYREVKLVGRRTVRLAAVLKEVRTPCNMVVEVKRRSGRRRIGHDNDND